MTTTPQETARIFREVLETHYMPHVREEARDIVLKLLATDPTTKDIIRRIARPLIYDEMAELIKQAVGEHVTITVTVKGDDQ